MKRVLSILSVITALCILLSCTVTGVTAEPVQEPQPPFYVLYPFEMMVAGLPKTIQGQFDYDRDYIAIASDYPGYENRGFVFPLASEEYGSLFDVSYTVNDTVITYTYTLKDGVTFDDVLDALDAVHEAQGALPVSRESGARHSFPIFNIVMKIDDASFMEFMAKVDDHKIIKVIDADGNELHENGRQDGDIVVWCPQKGLPDPNAPVTPTEATPTEAPVYAYRDKLLSQYNLSDSQLTEYDEIYEHKDSSGNTDWALVKAATQKQTSSLYTSPRYYEFGNRVMDTEYGGKPFSFDMGVYIAKYDRFFDVSAPELYELNGLERVWTDIGAGRLIGDMDGDNSLSIIDALLIRRCQAGLTNYPDTDKNIPSDMVANPIGYFSDFDQDGERDILDATCIQRYLANLQYRPAGWTPYPHNVQPTEPVPTEPAPTEPAPLPTEPAPTQATPTEPTQPAPTQPEPTETAPTEPAPTEPAPTEPAPTESDDPIPRITGFRSIGKGIEISLSRVKGAEKYRVYYWSNANSTWKSMGETTTNTFIDDDVTVGTTYRYTVRCIKADLSAFTSDFDHTGWKYTYDPQLDTPQISNLEAAANGIRISWKAVDGADLYRIYYKGEDGWTKIADVRSTSYLDTNVELFHTYTYTVRCLSARSKGFASSYEAQGQTLQLTNIPYITELRITIHGLEIFFNGSWNTNKYRIFRKQEGGSWERVMDTDVSEIVDGTVELFTEYTYTIRALSDDGRYYTSYFDPEGLTFAYNPYAISPYLHCLMLDSEHDLYIEVDDIYGVYGYALFVKNGEDWEYVTAFEGSEAYIEDAGASLEHGKKYTFTLIGLDENGEQLTGYREEGFSVTLTEPAGNITVEKTGTRRYTFTADGMPSSAQAHLLMVAVDPDTGEEIVYGPFTSYDKYLVEVDLSRYQFSKAHPSVEWNCAFYGTSDQYGTGEPTYFTFCESDYQ